MSSLNGDTNDPKTPGVFGISHSTSAGVSGFNDNTTPSFKAGVWGESKNGEGVHGVSHSQYAGTTGFNDGTGGLAPGVWGSSTNGEGVHGETHSSTFAAVAGIQLNPQGTGAGIYGESRGTGPAAFFKGNVTVTGDIFLANADCAEDFTVSDHLTAEPGTVMVIGEGDTLHPCAAAYDKRVAGVVSGAGDYKPGLILDRQQTRDGRRPVALMGKVYCKVDAQSVPVEVGDLLTTSDTLGYAMKAIDAQKAFGTVIGKALRPLDGGRGLIPILVALQ